MRCYANNGITSHSYGSICIRYINDAAVISRCSHIYTALSTSVTRHIVRSITLLLLKN